MKFARKEALVLTVVGKHAVPPRFVFYIDTDTEKIAFVNWYLMKLQKTDLFEGVTFFDGHVGRFPDGSSALYFEYNYTSDDHEAYERFVKRSPTVFPVGSDADKLGLFELIITGQMDTIFNANTDEPRLNFDKVQARVRMDTEKATEALETSLPIELAEKIVACAASEA